jgi:hypothetical protein
LTCSAMLTLRRRSIGADPEGAPQFPAGSQRQTLRCSRTKWSFPRKYPRFILLFMLLIIYPVACSAAATPTEEPLATPTIEIRASTPTSPYTPGSACTDSEGEWNCMTNWWQRCASAKWSVVMACADGTACTPAGLTYDFKVQFANQVGSGSSATSSMETMRRASLNLVVLAAIFSVILAGWLS